MPFLKITNSKEKHYDFQYEDGLNKLIGPFAHEGNCVSGGLYFSNEEHILKFLNRDGTFLREISLPLDDEDFKMVSINNKWRANKIILGKKYDLSKVSTFEYLISLGTNIQAYACDILKWAVYGKHIDIIRFLTKYDLTICAENSFLAKIHEKRTIDKQHIETSFTRFTLPGALKLAIKHGYLDVVLFIDKMISNVSIDQSFTFLKEAIENGHVDIVEFYMENYMKKFNTTLDIYSCAIHHAMNHKQTKIVNFLRRRLDDEKKKDNEAAREEIRRIFMERKVAREEIRRIFMERKFMHESDTKN